MERLDSAAYRARSKAVFGRALQPQRAVDTILDEVRERGDAAVIGYARRIDGVTLSAKTLRVSDAEVRNSIKGVPAKLRAALELAASRIADYQRRLLPENLAPAASRGVPGIKCGLAWTPLSRVGVYVP